MCENQCVQLKLSCMCTHTKNGKSLTYKVIEVSSCQINGKSFDYTLISRRCIYRAGTRFNVRGVDSEGQVANFVETEQIVQYNGHCCSFVQVC